MQAAFCPNVVASWIFIWLLRDFGLKAALFDIHFQQLVWV
jgi:hypothetical protein